MRSTPIDPKLGRGAELPGLCDDEGGGPAPRAQLPRAPVRPTPGSRRPVTALLFASSLSALSSPPLAASSAEARHSLSVVASSLQPCSAPFIERSPCRYRTYVVSVPTLVSFAWGIVANFLDPGTVFKIRLVGGFGDPALLDDFTTDKVV